VKPIFARTRHVYESYCDFWKFVELSGFETCFVDDIDLAAEAMYIFTPLNGEVIPHFRSQADRTRRARVIWWNLERPAPKVGDPTFEKSLDEIALLVDAIWVSDNWCAKQDPRLTYVLMGGHRAFGTPSSEKHFDLCHLSYLWGRRQIAVDQLVAAGLTIAPPAWTREQKDEAVGKSWCMLNLHQYAESALVAPIRFAVAASYSIPIISETFHDESSKRLCYIVDDLPNLVRQGAQLVKLQEPLLALGSRLHNELCIKTDFRHEVEKALHEL
jgi:hypothetical protein